MEKLKLIKYGHQFCGPCKMISPMLQKLSEELKDIIEFEDINTYEEDEENLINNKINAVPTIIIQKNGTEVFRHVGMISKDKLEQTIADLT